VPRRPDLSWDMKVAIFDSAAKHGPEKLTAITRDLDRLVGKELLNEPTPDPRTIKRTLEEFQTMPISLLAILPRHIWEIRQDWPTIRDDLQRKTQPGEIARAGKAPVSMDDHYRLLLRLGKGLLDAVYQDPIHPGSLPDGQTVLEGRAEGTVYSSSDIFGDRGVDLEGRSEFGLDAEEAGLPRRFALRLLNALWEHEPQLKGAFGNWKTRWNNFRKVRRKLLDEAGKLLKKELEKAEALSQKISCDEVGKLQSEVVSEVLTVRLLVEESKSSRVEVNRNKSKDLVRYNQQGQTTVYYRGFGDVEAIRKAYEYVFQQVSHEETLWEVESTYCLLKNCIPRVEELVDDFVLRGRPRRQCDLCSPV